MILANSFQLVKSICGRINSVAIERDLRKIGAGNAATIPTYTNPLELAALYNLACNTSSECNALEIGSHLGASTCYLVAGIARNRGKIYCVDPWMNETMPGENHDTFPEFMSNIGGASRWVVTVRKPSEYLLKTDIATPLDLVFIDGDHDYEAVKADFHHIVPWVSRDGTIAFHDSLYFLGVRRVIGEALLSGEWVVAGSIANLCWLKRAPEIVAKL